MHIVTWKGTKHLVLAELHRKYGHVVRINHDELSFTDPDAWKDVCVPLSEHSSTVTDHCQIYGHGSRGKPGSPPTKDWVRFGKTLNGHPSLLQARDPDHARQRKIFTPAFSDRALKQQEPLFLKYASQLVEKLKELSEQDTESNIDMVQLLNFATFDIMADLTFGEPLHMLGKAE
jgi:cytochrome P450